jgi:hypothetical protein
MLPIDRHAHAENSSATAPNETAIHRSDVPGVRYATRNHAWAAEWPHPEQGSTSTPRRVTRFFSVRRLGYDEAKRLAEAARLEAGAHAVCSQVGKDGGAPCHRQSKPTVEDQQQQNDISEGARTGDAHHQQQPTSGRKRDPDPLLPAKSQSKRPRSALASDPDRHPQSTVNCVSWNSVSRAWVAGWIDIDTGTHNCTPAQHSAG